MYDGGWSDAVDEGETLGEFMLDRPAPYDLPSSFIPAARYASSHLIFKREISEGIFDRSNTRQTSPRVWSAQPNGRRSKATSTTGRAGDQTTHQRRSTIPLQRTSASGNTGALGRTRSNATNLPTPRTEHSACVPEVCISCDQAITMTAQCRCS